MASTTGQFALVDVLIQTFNEEMNLPHTLESVLGWANRVFVVDSGSTDRTITIAERMGAVVFSHGWEGYAAQKNWALANLPFEAPWVLILDADEAVSPQLRTRIESIVNRNPDDIATAGYYINRVFIFQGKRIKHCGYYPSWNLRLFKRGKAVYEQRLVHEHMIVDGPTEQLPRRDLLLHEDRRGLEHFFAKHNRYSTYEAIEIFRNPEPWPGLRRFFTDRIARRRFGKSRILPYLPMPWIFRFLYMYFVRLGFLDGVAGWRLCWFISAYELFVQLKYRELKRTGGTIKQGQPALCEPEGVVQVAQPEVASIAPASAPAARFEPVKPARLRDESDAKIPPRARPAPRDANGQSIPTLIWNDVRDPHVSSSQQEVAKFVSPWSFRENVGRVLWMFVQATLFRASFHNWYGWRRFLLRRFGAKIGHHVRIRPSARIEIPWNLTIGDSSVIGDYAILYSLGKISIGRLVIVSQYAHLCAGTHDHRYRDFPLVKPPIVVGDEAWIASDAYVGPGVTVGDRAVLGARSSAFKDIPSDCIAVGNPAKVLRDRVFVDSAETDPETAPAPAASHRTDPPVAS